MISPPIMLLGLPALAARPRYGSPAGARPARAAWLRAPERRRDRSGSPGFSALAAVRAAEPDLSRTSYLYYMVIVMPGIYMSSPTWSAAPLAARAMARGLWALAVLVAAVLMYPFIAAL